MLKWLKDMGVSWKRKKVLKRAMKHNQVELLRRLFDYR